MSQQPAWIGYLHGTNILRLCLYVLRGKLRAQHGQTNRLHFFAIYYVLHSGDVLRGRLFFRANDQWIFSRFEKKRLFQ